MSAQYQLSMSADAFEAWDRTALPDGMRVAEVGPFDIRTCGYLITVDDDGAPQEFSGETVFPLLRIQADRSVAIAARGVPW